MANKEWNRVDAPKELSLVRFYGKTYPCITYSFKENKILARENNGNCPMMLNGF